MWLPRSGQPRPGSKAATSKQDRPMKDRLLRLVVAIGAVLAIAAGGWRRRCKASRTLVPYRRLTGRG